MDKLGKFHASVGSTAYLMACSYVEEVCALSFSSQTQPISQIGHSNRTLLENYTTDALVLLILSLELQLVDVDVMTALEVQASYDEPKCIDVAWTTKNGCR